MLIYSAFMSENDFIFYMIGIIHRDSQCAVKLAEWLEEKQPDVITIELSNFGLAFREKMGDFYKKNLEENLKRLNMDTNAMLNHYIEDIKKYIEIPYEYRVAQKYVKKNRGFIYLIDLDIFSFIKLKEIDTLFDLENIRNLLNLEDKGEETASERLFARLYFEKGIKAFPYTEEMRIRDIHMKDRISLLIRCHNERKFTHICGWQHLCDPHGIYKTLNPIKVFIYDQDICI